MNQSATTFMTSALNSLRYLRHQGYKMRTAEPFEQNFRSRLERQSDRVKSIKGYLLFVVSILREPHFTIDVKADFLNRLGITLADTQTHHKLDYVAGLKNTSIMKGEYRRKINTALSTIKEELSALQTQIAIERKTQAAIMPTRKQTRAIQISVREERWWQPLRTEQAKERKSEELSEEEKEKVKQLIFRSNERRYLKDQQNPENPPTTLLNILVSERLKHRDKIKKTPPILT